mmetsp:Transcript_3682/g.11431  ORF Transcript_3682/g.11431 Transcript_3682/m.11431 type:complete len:222 (+) Transcript_3682:546-1211(+)
MAEAHELERIALVLGAREELGDPVRRANLPQHADARLVRAPMHRSPETSNAGRDARERVRLGRGGHPDRRRRRVLLVIRVQEEKRVQRLFKGRRRRHEFSAVERRRKTHVQQVCRERLAAARRDVRHADGVSVRHGRDRRELRDDSNRRERSLRVVHRADGGVVEEGGQRAHGPYHDRHRMCAVWKSSDKGLEALVACHAPHHLTLEELETPLRRRQVAVQ